MRCAFSHTYEHAAHINTCMHAIRVMRVTLIVYMRACIYATHIFMHMRMHDTCMYAIRNAYVMYVHSAVYMRACIYAMHACLYACTRGPPRKLTRSQICACMTYACMPYAMYT